MIIAGWFLFRVVALFVLQFFAEDVVRAVEAKHYPHAAHGVRDIPFTEEIGNALRGLRAFLGGCNQRDAHEIASGIDAARFAREETAGERGHIELFVELPRKHRIVPAGIDPQIEAGIGHLHAGRLAGAPYVATHHHIAFADQAFDVGHFVLQEFAR